MPANTTRLALPYPLPDDTVDVPRDVKALAEKLDTAAVPAIVTTLPTGSPEGTELYLQPPAAVAGDYVHLWHLRRVGSLWIPLHACQPMRGAMAQDSQQSPAASAWGVLTDPRLDVPFTGTWEAEGYIGGASLEAASLAATWGIGLAGAVVADSETGGAIGQMNSYAGGAFTAQMSTPWIRFAATAGQVVQIAEFRTGLARGIYRRLSLRPLALAAS